MTETCPLITGADGSRCPWPRGGLRAGPGAGGVRGLPAAQALGQPLPPRLWKEPHRHRGTHTTHFCLVNFLQLPFDSDCQDFKDNLANSYTN